MGVFDKVKQYFSSDTQPSEPSVQMEDIAWGSSRIYANEQFPQYNPDELIGRKGYKIYRQMMLDEQVKAVTLFRLNSITGRKHFFKMPKHSTLSPEEAARRIHIYKMILMQMPGTFKTVMDGIMSAMHMGFSLTERVHKLIDIDGKTYVGLKSLKTKPPESFEPYFDKFDNLVKLKQHVDAGEQDLDINNFIHHVNNRNVHSFYGQSEIREAYRPYFSKDITIRFHNMWLERMAAGFIWAQPEKGSTLIKGTPEHTALTSALSSIRNHTSLIMPKGVTLNVEHPTDTKAFESAIAMDDKAIAKALLVPNLLGLSEQGSTGSFAQSKTQLEAFLWDLDAAAAYLAETLNEQLFNKLGEANFGDGVYPIFEFQKLSIEQAQTIITQWRELAQANIVKSTEEDENLIRNYLDIPEREITKEPEEDTSTITAPDSALNGAQVKSMLDVTLAVAAGQLPKDAAKQLLVAAYPISIAMAKGIIEPIEIKETTEVKNVEGLKNVNSKAAQSGSKIDQSDSEKRAQESGGQGNQENGKGGLGASDGGRRTSLQNSEKTNAVRMGREAFNRDQTATNQCSEHNHNGECVRSTFDRYDHGGSSYDYVGSRINFAKHTQLRRVQFAAIDRASNLIGLSYTDQLGSELASLTDELIDSTVTAMDFENPDMALVTKAKATPSRKRELKSIANKMLREAYALGQDHAKAEIDRAAKDNKRLMSKANFAHIEDQAAKFYRAQSFIMAGNMSDKVEAIIRNEVMRGIQNTKSQQEVTQAIYDRMVSEGLIPANEVPEGFFNEAMQNITPLYRLETIVRNGTFSSINEARSDYFEDPALDGFVEAYQYSAIIDSVTTVICNELGDPETPFIRLVDDPIWKIYRPQNHHNCRALLIALINGDTYTVSPNDPVNIPQVGFG